MTSTDPGRLPHVINALAATAVLATMPLQILAATDNPPNVLFIAIDDLNDWVGCLGCSVRLEFDEQASWAGRSQRLADAEHL